MRASALICVFAAIVGVGGAARAAETGQTPALAVSRAFLDAYGRGDKSAVLASVSSDATVYGSDSAEIFHGLEGVSRLLDQDKALWGGPVHFGPFRDVSEVAIGDADVITFQSPFELAGRPPVLVRFTMVWRRRGTGWELLQSVNTVPTIGQSAEALLKGRP